MRESLERDLVKCEDMRIHAENACRFLGNMTLDDFSGNDMVQAAVIRSIEVIGEAAKQISAGSRHLAPEIPWPLIVGMRNVLIHDYGTIDIEKVYDVVKEYLPGLLQSLVRVITEIEREVGWNEPQE